MTGRRRLWAEAAKLSFFNRVAGLSLKDGVRRSVIWEELGVEPLLLRSCWGTLLGYLLDAQVVEWRWRCSGRIQEDPGHAREIMSFG